MALSEDAAAQCMIGDSTLLAAATLPIQFIMRPAAVAYVEVGRQAAAFGVIRIGWVEAVLGQRRGTAGSNAHQDESSCSGSETG